MRFVGLLDPAQIPAFSFIASFTEGHMIQCGLHTSFQYEQDQTTMRDGVCKGFPFVTHFK